MKKNIFSIALMAAVLTAWWGCSSSDDGGTENRHITYVDQPPSWTVNVPVAPGSVTEKQAWNYAVSRKYPNSMTAIMVIDSLLEPAPQAADSMAASIGGELRCVTAPVRVDGEMRFMMYIDYETEGAMVDIHYYNARTNKVYTVANAFSVNDDTVGASSALVFSPYLSTDVTVTIDATVPFKAAEGDMIAIAEGNIVYGTGKYAGNSHSWTLCCRSQPGVATTAHIYYYSAAMKAVYQFQETVLLSDGKPVAVKATLPK